MQYLNFNLTDEQIATIASGLTKILEHYQSLKNWSPMNLAYDLNKYAQGLATEDEREYADLTIRILFASMDNEQEAK